MDDPTGYLFRTAMNAVRKRARRASMAIRRVVAPPPPEDPFSQVDARRDVVRALADLDRKQRAAIVLTGLLGYSSEEAGQMLGMSAGSVRVLGPTSATRWGRSPDGRPCAPRSARTGHP
jgi:RNA polymerase sigma factor (sigma-70 family)